jgi:2-hydroxychromene-2-carboxylate isomerase
MPHLTIYLDILSPFAYLLFTRVLESPLAPHAHVVPIFLGGLMNLTTNRPPLDVPLKGTYIFHDFKRQARRYNIPLLPAGMPDPFPFNTLHAMRAVCAIEDEAERLRVLEALFKAVWVEGRGAGEDVLREAVGEKWAEVEARIETIGKKLLTENTEEAVKSGAFGVPWVVGKLSRARGEEAGADRNYLLQRRRMTARRMCSGALIGCRMWRDFWEWDGKNRRIPNCR